MRKINVTQKGLFDQTFNDMLTFMPVEKELIRINDILEDMPEIVKRVHNDLQQPGLKAGGRPGIHAERVFRVAILKTLKRLPYREVSKVINGNLHYRWFTKYNTDKVPHFSTLQKLVKKISPETLSEIQDIMVEYARESKIEKGHTLRVDTTVVEADIGYPIDAKLLKDSVRVLTRIMIRAHEFVPGNKFNFAKRTRRANKRSYQIVMAKGPNVKSIRKKHYKDLIKVANEVFEMGCQCLKHLEKCPCVKAFALSEQLDHYLTHAAVALDQCERRILNGEKVPSNEKIVSIFEDHTDIIMRGKTQSPTEFGHKVLFVTGKSGLITQYTTYEGNPGDNTMVSEILDSHKQQFSKPPKRLAGDRRFFSADNEKIAYGCGVKQVSVCKPGYRSKQRLEIEKKGWFKRLQKFRAGIEGTISALMRGCGLKRCRWKGWRSFKSYVGLSVITFNLRKLATI